MRVIDNDYLTMLSRLLIGGIFIYASLYKLIEPAAFAQSIWYYHIVPGSLINLIAIVLPWLEILMGAGLIFGVWYRGAVLWSNVLTVVFIIALVSTVARGLDIECGCFKAAHSATESAWTSIWFDVVMLVFTLQMLFSRSRRWMVAARR